MPASYPSSIKSFVTILTNDVVQADDPNDIQNEVTAIETGLISGIQHVLKPLTNNAYDLGSSSLGWKDLYLIGALYKGANPFTGWTVISNTETGALNNWAPAGLSGNTLIEWNGASAAAPTGLAGGYAGQVVLLKNITAAQVITFPHASGSSDAAKRFTNLATSAVTPVASGGWIAYMHDGTNWKLIAHEQGAWITPTFAAGDYTASGSLTWTVGSGDVTTAKYRLVGKTLHWMLTVITTTTGGTASNTLIRALFGGFTAAADVRNAFPYLDKATAGTGMCQVTGTVINFFKDISAGNWDNTATDQTSVQAQGVAEVT